MKGIKYQVGSFKRITGRFKCSYRQVYLIKGRYRAGGRDYSVYWQGIKTGSGKIIIEDWYGDGRI